MNTKINGNTKGRIRRPFLAGLVLGMVLLPGRGISGPAGDAGGPVPALIKVLEVGRAVAVRGLSIVPIYRTDNPKAKDFAQLSEALKNGWIEIAELDGGRVPQVRISNLSKRTIYLMGGEILTGARQDRILASDLLLGPGTKNLVAPVFCVEHGRWTAVSPTFTTKNNIGTYDLRAKATAQGSAAQAEIWDRVAEQNVRVGVASPTGAYQDAYESPANKRTIGEIEEKMAAIPRLMKDTVGVVIGLGAEIVSADIFDDPGLFQKQWPKILRSAALSALGRQRQGALAQTAAADFLKAFVDKTYQMRKSLDLGMEHSSLDGAVNIQALVYENAVIHLAAFAQEGVGKDTDGKTEERLRVIRYEQRMIER